MNPSSVSKKEFSAFVPYRKSGNDFEFFMQKRAITVALNPGLLGFFGGKIQGDENFTDAFFREIKEELGYVPTHSVYFSRYETARAVIHVFIEEVADNFETQVVVAEGDYGKFMTRTELRSSTEASVFAQMAVWEIQDFLIS